MVTLTFDLDYEKMRVDGITEYDMLNPMREHSKQYEQQIALISFVSNTYLRCATLARRISCG